MAIKRAKIFTFTSVRGGTGKTTTVLNVAGVLSKLNKRVLIMDFDLYGGALALSLNVSNETDIFKLVDDLSNNRFDYIENYLTKYNENIDVLPAPKDPRVASKISNKYIELLLSKVSMKYDVILIDTNYFMNDINLTAMDLSEQIFYVVNNNPIDMKNMRTMMSIYSDMNKTNYKIILNESTHIKKEYFSKYDIKSIIRHGIDYLIPNSFYIKNIDAFVLDGRILTLDNDVDKKHKKAINVFINIANDMLNKNRR